MHQKVFFRPKSPKMDMFQHDPHITATSVKHRISQVTWIVDSIEQNWNRAYDGRPSRNWITWILLMIWLSCPTPYSRCKKRTLVWRNTQHVWGWIPIEERAISSKWTQQVQSQSHWARKRSKRSNTSHIWAASLTHIAEPKQALMPGKERVAIFQLKNIWKSKVLSLKTRSGCSIQNVKAVLLYRAEIWRTSDHHSFNICSICFNRWNSLSQEDVDVMTVNAFKKRLELKRRAQMGFFEDS